MSETERMKACERIVEESGLAWMDLTLEEKRYFNAAAPAQLRGAINRREPQHFEYGLALAEDDIPEDAVEYWVADVDEAAIETIMQAQDIKIFEELPDNAVLFWDNADLAFYQTPNGSVYVTESLNAESLSDPEPVTEWDESGMAYDDAPEVDNPSKEEELAMRAAVNIFDYLIDGLEAARNNLVRKL